MNTAPWERTLVVAFLLIGVSVLGAMDKVSEALIASVYTGILGYVVGHGAGAAAERRRVDNGNGVDRSGKPG